MQENFSFINLGLDYFIFKFSNKVSQKTVILDRPWFFPGAYLLVQIWEENFFSQELQIESTTIWVRYPKYLMNYMMLWYYKEWVKKLGAIKGRLLYVDYITKYIYRYLCPYSKKHTSEILSDYWQVQKTYSL